MSRSDWWPSYPRRRRLAVKDGVQARKGNKGFATRWWARRGQEAMGKFAGPSHLARGRPYARRGQVMDYQVSAGVVTAKVQGSRRTPYEVRIALAAFRDLTQREGTPIYSKEPELTPVDG